MVVSLFFGFVGSFEEVRFFEVWKINLFYFSERIFGFWYEVVEIGNCGLGECFVIEVW